MATSTLHVHHKQPFVVLNTSSNRAAVAGTRAWARKIVHQNNTYPVLVKALLDMVKVCERSKCSICPLPMEARQIALAALTAASRKGTKQ